MTFPSMPAEGFMFKRWLFVGNSIAWTFALMPLLAPVLLAAGLVALAEPIYSAYSLFCHQWPHRSFFLLGPQATYTLTELAAWTSEPATLAYLGSPTSGYKLAFCERDLAIYVSIAAAGTLYAMHRARVKVLSIKAYAWLLVPIALDGFTQLFGWRESTPLLRLFTGICFGAGTVWFIYPRVDVMFSRLHRTRDHAWRPAAS
jgi:uncharacterized membrane protein